MWALLILLYNSLNSDNKSSIYVAFAFQKEVNVEVLKSCILLFGHQEPSKVAKTQKNVL